MKALRDKWNSRRGASILLALLFLLVCVMVGSSVLMAAASNTGKVRSNRDEQQKYLTLSSALTLVCNKLENMQYVGKCSYNATSNSVDYTDGEGNVVSTSVTNIYTCTFKAQSLDAMINWDLEKVLPLQSHLDYVVSELFKNKTSASSSFDYDEGDITVTVTDEYVWKSDPEPARPAADNFTMYLKADADDLEGGIGDTVQIDAAITLPDLTDATRLDDSIVISLTAILLDAEGKPTYKMYARLESDKLLEAPDYGSATAGTLKWYQKYISKISGGS